MMNKQNREENYHQISQENPQLQDIIEKIIKRELKKVYDKKSPFYGKNYYKLKIAEEEEKQKRNIFVYSNIISQQTNQVIEQSLYIDKRYVFSVKKQKKPD